MKTIKVKKTREVTTSQSGTVQCAEGKLVLIECKPEEANFSKNHNTNQMWLYRRIEKNYTNVKYYKSIIISETDEIGEDDRFWDAELNKIRVAENREEAVRADLNRDPYNTGHGKILALPKHFTEKQLQAIVDGKMKDGDVLMVECEKYYPEKDEENFNNKDYWKGFTLIKQPLTLHKEKKTNTELAQAELISLLECQIMDLTMMSKIELGDDVIQEIRRLKDIIGNKTQESWDDLS